jgi:hypothetical protein
MLKINRIGNQRVKTSQSLLSKYSYVKTIHQPQYRKIEKHQYLDKKNKKIENRKRVFIYFTHSAAKNQYRSIFHMQITLKPMRKKSAKYCFFTDRKVGTYQFKPTSGNHSPIYISQQDLSNYSIDVHRFQKIKLNHRNWNTEYVRYTKHVKTQNRSSSYNAVQL